MKRCDRPLPGHKAPLTPTCGSRAALYGLPALLVLLFASPASAQVRPTGYVSTFVDFFPNRGDAAETRVRAFAEQSLASDRVQVTVSAFAEGLLAWRRAGDESARERVTDAVARAQEATVLVRAGRLDLYAGYGVIAWGRLDELQPTDVINPLDVSRFFFEGRSGARLPVAFVRTRLYAAGDVSVEAVYVPVFRRGRFDRLDEPTSPFNLAASRLPLPAEETEPAASFRNAQGGARLTATTGRVDWSVTAFRGFEPFGLYSLAPASAPGASPRASVSALHPRFTMLGGDFEAVAGNWGVRGEIAAFVRDSFQGEAPVPSIVRGSSFDAGAGVDRKAGDYRVSGTVLVHREAYDAPLVASAAPETSRTDVSFIASADRAFAREKYNVRLFGVYGATEGSGFVRAIATAKLRDDVAVEGSAGWFAGGGRDLVGRFADSDFVYARLKVYF